jgi:hypothetical protein
MDEILVLQAGRILERGQPYELLQAEGLYRQMWQLQHNYSNLTFGSWQGLEFIEMSQGGQSIFI